MKRSFFIFLSIMMACCFLFIFGCKGQAEKPGLVEKTVSIEIAEKAAESTIAADALSCFVLNDKAHGCTEEVDNIVNTSIVSRDDSVFKAEYQAGFIQGHLQKNSIIAARDNMWDGLYLMSTSHAFPKQIPPTAADMALAQDALLKNYNYTVKYAQGKTGTLLGTRMGRLLFRLLGIYHGTKLAQPAALDFSGKWLPATDYFDQVELQLGYETPNLTFLDIAWMNGAEDTLDFVGSELSHEKEKLPEKCSAFVKKIDGDVVIAHNSWIWFLAQSQALNLMINDDYLSMNIIMPGIIASMADFGYNNKGIMFNETTHQATYSEPKVECIWTYMRAALAEEFAGSLDEFFELMSLDFSGTYMNGYMIVDAKTKEIGLVEMSYRTFVYYKPDGKGGYNIITKPENRSKEYDHDMITADYIMGINYPASHQVREDLKAIDSRPARKRQFMEKLGDVTNIEDAKALITYTDPKNPLSIYGRWDLGYGETPTPKTIPEGAVDSKAATASMALKCQDFKGVLDKNAGTSSFWMKYGSAKVDGKPYTWSASKWNSQKLRDVPDVIDGNFQYLKAYIK